MRKSYKGVIHQVPQIQRDEANASHLIIFHNRASRWHVTNVALEIYSSNFHSGAHGHSEWDSVGSCLLNFSNKNCPPPPPDQKQMPQHQLGVRCVS